MSGALILAGIILVSLVLYSLLGGADFGAGFWDLTCFGKRWQDQRDLITQAIHPVWETNHVWLVLIIVMLFSGFPAVFSLLCVALAVPIYLILLGIVLRGSSYVFRAYLTGSVQTQLYWGTVFSISSSLTPIFLGIVIGAISSDTVISNNGISQNGFLETWFHPFPLTVGLLSLSLFAYLSACYLTVETKKPALKDDFKNRALISSLVSAALAVVTYILAGEAAQGIRAGLLENPWARLTELGAAISAVVAFRALWTRKFRLARIAAATQVTLILLGWGVSQYPYLIRPDLTISNSASPAPVVSDLVIAIAVGALVLIPSLAALFRVFKANREASSTDEFTPLF
jgi:cytochrome bd ubiquinol oxidase subunit II